MKFIIFLVIIGLVAAASTKEELLKKATDLEAKFQADVEKVRASHPIEIQFLEREIRELKNLASELETAKEAHVVALLEQRLADAERRAEWIIKRIEGQEATNAAP